MEGLLIQAVNGIDCGYLVILGVLIGAGLLRSVQAIPGVPIEPPGDGENPPADGDDSP